MAENAANFTQTFQNKPSIFEILAQKSLGDTLYPALQKLALFLSSNFPKKFGFLNVYYDEAFLVLDGFLQLYYLKYFNASFSESFYGLKRVLSNGEALTKHEKELSLIFLVAIPYFKKKIEDKLQIYRIENAECGLQKDFEGRSKRFLIITHSMMEIMWGLITLNNYLKYMADKTDFQLPLLSLLNLKLTYSNEEPSASFWAALFGGKLRFTSLSFGLMKNAVSTVLETTAFFLQFLQAWNIQKPNFSITDLPKVEPPAFDNRAKTLQGRCPICLQKWLIPTVLPVSGYIFCFRCILRSLSDTQKCPVTNLPARPLDIVRIYTNS